MNCCCENCGWSEIIGSPIMCNYTGHRTWRDECCEAWKPKEEKSNMVEVVRCKDCKKCDLPEEEPYEDGYCSRCGYVKMDWFCADGESREMN